MKTKRTNLMAINIIKSATRLIERFATMHIVADPEDSTITLSKWLCRHARIIESETETRAVIVKADGQYALAFNPDIDEETLKTLPKVQYCGKTRTIGFQTNYPTVTAMMYELGMQENKPQTMKAQPRKAPNGVNYYILEPQRRCR